MIWETFFIFGKICGMRHPSSGLSEDDLSRLTGSSTTTSTPSHDSNNSKTCAIIPILNDNESINNIKNTQHFNSSYLPEIIDPLEWQKSRKRKERQDSTSSTTQERKLIRSNSEELISNADCEVIRRVSSHEDFKKPLQELSVQNVLKTVQEDINCSDSVKDMARSRIETSPARSHRVSPSRDGRNGKYKDSDDSDWDHERRRSNERFCKARAAPGRKFGVLKKTNKYFSARFRERDENVYKYDITSMKYERRGFVSKVKLEERNRKEEAADGEQRPTNDYNDNNLIDFHIRGEYKHYPSSASDASKSAAPTNSSPQRNDESSVEALPWDCSIPEDQTPVLCRRFASIEDCTQDTRSQLPSPIPPVADNEPVKSFRTFTNSENLKTREIMQNLPPLGLFQTPEERLKHINKKLTALKKRVSQLEENYERNYGYRPSQVERFNDKQIKNVLAEISKLRKEKHELKLDPMAALGLKVNGGMDAQKKLTKMKETLAEIEKKLEEKRIEASRPVILDTMTPDQLIQEKAAVQHGLLYFESLYGRPSTRDERDTARPLYERYRIIKRMITRSITISSGNPGLSELPTILEHEAMVFTMESGPSQASNTEATESPEFTCSANVDSPSDNSGSAQSTDSAETSNLGENIHTLSIDELWQHLEIARDEKKLLKKTIQDFENLFEEQNGRKMLKGDRKAIEDTYAQYKEKKAKVRLLQALIKKHIS